jgi:LmbE family N-acetylglucosaminyl deacetylase
MIPLNTGGIGSVAAIGAHCDDILIGAGATLMQIAQHNPGVVVHALVLTGAGTERETEEKFAFSTLLPGADVRLTVADLPDGRLPDHWGTVKQRVADFRRECEPDLVIGPQRDDYHQDHRMLAELIPTEFRAHLVLGYEILKWESDLPKPTLYVEIPDQLAHEKTRLLAQSYASQAGRDWFDSEAFLGLMRVRGVQCRSRYAEAFVAEKAVVSPFGVHSLN